MSIVFNLKKSLQQIKMAMAEVYEDRPYEWFTVDQIKGNDPEWTKWITGHGTYKDSKGVVHKTKQNKSLVNAVASALNSYYAKKLLFRSRYGASDEEVDTFYKFVIGYSPFRGMRSCGVGPYTAKDEAWAFAKQKMKENGLTLQTPTIMEDLLTLSKNHPVPTLPPDLDAEDKVNKKNPLVINYKLQIRHKRELLEVRADLMNKFSSFEKTFNKIDRSEMNKGINSYMQRLLNEFGIMFDKDTDIGIVVKSFDPDPKNIGKIDESADWISTEFESLNPNDPKGKKLFDSGIMPGVGTFLKLNPRGINKLFQKFAQEGNWSDLYEKAINMIAVANGKTVEETRVLVAEDKKFSDMLFNELKNIENELNKKVPPDPRAKLMKLIHKTNVKDPPKMGAQQAQTYRVGMAQRSILELKKELLEAVVKIGTDDPVKVAAAIASGRATQHTKAKGMLNAEFIPQWLNAIRSEDEAIQKIKKQKKVRPYADILVSVTKDLDSLYMGNELRDAGVNDLETALRLQSTKHMKSPLEYIDIKTKAPLQFVNAPNMFAKPGEENIPVTAKDLTEMRLTREAKMPEEVLQKQIEEEIKKEIGDLSKVLGNGIEENVVLSPEEDKGKEEEKKDQEKLPSSDGVETPVAIPGEPDFGVTEIPTVPEVPQEKIDLTPDATPIVPGGDGVPVSEVKPEGVIPAPAATNIPPVPKKKKKKTNFKEMVASTVKSLIILARDLDSQGKDKSAEEIHKVIRKYQNKN